MKIQLKRWFSAPQVNGDDELQRKAALTNAIIIGAIVLEIVITISMILWRFEDIRAVLFGLGGIALTVLMRFALFQGKYTLSEAGVIAIGLVMVTFSIAELGTIRVPALTGYLLLVMIAGLLFDKRGVVIITSLASLLTLTLIAAQNAGYLAKPNYAVNPIHWINFSILLVVTAFLTNFAVQTNQRSIQRARKEVEERKQTARLQETVYRIAEDASAAQSLAELYPRIHQRVMEMMPAKNFYIVLQEPDRQLLRFVYAVDEVDTFPQEPVPVDYGLTGYVFKRRQSLLFIHRIHQGLTGQPRTTAPASVWLGAPLIAAGKTIGVMAVQHYSDEHAYTEREQHLLEYVSTQVAAAIERKRSEEALRASEERFRLLAENANDLIFRFRLAPTPGFEYVSPSAVHITGYTPEEHYANPQLGQKMAHPEDVPFLEQFMNDPTGLQHPVTLRWIHRNGQVIWTETVYHLVFANDQPVVMEGISRDITERKLAEEALQAARNELEQRVQERTAELKASSELLKETNLALQKAFRTRDEFMAAMSHELRTPLTGIMGLSDILIENIYGELNERQKRAAEGINASGQRLLTLVNDLLDYTQLASGRLQMQTGPCDLVEICRSGLQAVETKSVKKMQQMNYHCTPANIELVADARRLKQILVNLLDNAVKFTPENGQIELSITGLAEQQQVQIRVQDTGIGIPEEEFERLFKPFVQLDARLARIYEGTGLGLALVRALVELHGGSVAVESVVGQGSTFSVTLPWNMPAVPAVSPAINNSRSETG